MNKIALCIRQDRIAPRYDQPESLVIVELDEKSRIRSKTRFAVTGLSKTAICQKVLGLEAGVVICGGILADCQQALCKANIHFIDNVIGSEDAVLAAYLQGNLNSGDILD